MYSPLMMGQKTTRRMKRVAEREAPSLGRTRRIARAFHATQRACERLAMFQQEETEA
ncbi:hypothetical protein D3C87_1662230 [compost metagenome]